MADLMNHPVMGTESGNFDNDFEKVERDPPGADDVTSSTEADFFTTAPVPAAAASSEAAAASAPLLDFDTFAASTAPYKNPEPVAKPDSSSAAMGIKPSSPPMKPETVGKCVSSTGNVEFISPA